MGKGKETFDSYVNQIQNIAQAETGVRPARDYVESIITKVGDNSGGHFEIKKVQWLVDSIVGGTKGRSN